VLFFGSEGGKFFSGEAFQRAFLEHGIFDIFEVGV